MCVGTSSSPGSFAENSVRPHTSCRRLSSDRQPLLRLKSRGRGADVLREVRPGRPGRESAVRLQVIDPAVHFECSRCTRCCDQPWRTVIEPDKAAALDGVDWGAEYPALAGRELYRAVRQGKQTVLELAKGTGTRCIFLDDDNLCIIHKKLGYEAKPQMCKQFPFFPARAWDADYVSANFGCKAVQEGYGPPLVEQAEVIGRTVRLTDKPANTEAAVLLTRTAGVPQVAARALLERLGSILVADGEASIVSRLAEALATLERATEIEARELEEAVRSGAVTAEPNPELCEPFASAADAPMPSRFLFAATLFPDTLPPDTSGDLGLIRRMALVPKLFALARMQGVYASRLLGRNVRIDEVLHRPADTTMTPEATALLGRYLRSRLWQQFPGGTQLPIFSAVHQHILDINAVVFYACAAREAEGDASLDLPAVQHALMLVEFHLANQPRLFNQALRNWLRASLAAPALAWASLRMIRCAGPVAVA